MRFCDGHKERKKVRHPTIQMSALRFPVSRETEFGAETFGSLEGVRLGQAVARATCKEARTEYSMDPEKFG